MNQSQNPSSIRSRKEITDALLKLMQEHPYQDISVKQIILETNLARRTFYRNYESKDDVLDSVITDKITEYAGELTASPESPLDVIFRFCEKNKDFLMLLHNGCRSLHVKAAVKRSHRLDYYPAAVCTCTLRGAFYAADRRRTAPASAVALAAVSRAHVADLRPEFKGVHRKRRCIFSFVKQSL